MPGKKKTNFPLMTKAEKREKAGKLMASGNTVLPLPLFEALHPEEVRTDSILRISPLGLRYRSGKFIEFKETVKNFVETFKELCEGQAPETCIEEQIMPDFGNFCLFGKKPCVKSEAIKIFRESWIDPKTEDPLDEAPESYWQELIENEKRLHEEIPF